ncbi:MAG: MBL fold metallo-hydrolase [Candidatus Micrarchaeaceae archaeon]
MKVRFLGAAREVGRSCIMIEHNGSKALLDSGVKIGKESVELPLIDERSVKELEAVVISHAHLDHCGFLPHLTKMGYSKRIFGTKPTLDLCSVLVSDYLNISKPEGIERREVSKVQDLYKQVNYFSPFKTNGLAFRLIPAGHILGSSMIEVWFDDHTLLYTGDLNLRSTTILDGAYMEGLKADTLIIESTYGGKEDKHPAEKEVVGKMIKSINETLLSGGKVIIPTFAVGRAQEVLFILDNYMRSGKLEKAPIYMDGMVKKAMKIYRHNVVFAKEEIQRRILMSDDDPFKSPNFVEVKGREMRKKVIGEESPCIIVTTSGMLTGGPVHVYLKHLAHDSKNKLLLVGYQAEGTAGRMLTEGAGEIQINDAILKVNMKVEFFHLSAHADRQQLLSFIGKVSGLKRVILLHGEERKGQELKSSLEGSYETILPNLGEEIEL